MVVILDGGVRKCSVVRSFAFATERVALAYHGGSGHATPANHLVTANANEDVRLKSAQRKSAEKTGFRKETVDFQHECSDREIN